MSDLFSTASVVARLTNSYSEADRFIFSFHVVSMSLKHEGPASRELPRLNRPWVAALALGAASMLQACAGAGGRPEIASAATAERPHGSFERVDRSMSALDQRMSAHDPENQDLPNPDGSSAQVFLRIGTNAEHTERFSRVRGFVPEVMQDIATTGSADVRLRLRGMHLDGQFERTPEDAQRASDILQIAFAAEQPARAVAQGSEGVTVTHVQGIEAGGATEGEALTAGLWSMLLADDPRLAGRATSTETGYVTDRPGAIYTLITRAEELHLQHVRIQRTHRADGSGWYVRMEGDIVRPTTE